MANKTAISSTKKSEDSGSHKKKLTIKAATNAVKYKNVLSSYKAFCRTLKKTPLVGIMLAEFIGTLLLTASFIEMQSHPIYVGFALIGIVLVVGGISGAHFNPAATVGAWVTRKINAAYAFGYIAAQLLGATSAWLILKTFLNESTGSATATGAQNLYQAAGVAAGKEWYVFFAELLGAAILTMGIATAIRLKHDKTTAALVSGFSILVALYISMSITTAVLTAQGTLTFLNPAIASVSNALVFSSKEWAATVAIYIIAPLIGGIIGFVLHDFMQSQTDHDDCDCCK